MYFEKRNLTHKINTGIIPKIISKPTFPITFPMSKPESTSPDNCTASNTLSLNTTSKPIK